MLLEIVTTGAVQTAQAGFFSEWLAGMNLGGLILLAVGTALIIIEMLIPGFGIAGVSGGAAVIAGLIVSSESFGAAMFSLGIVVIVLCIAAFIIFKLVFGKRKRSSRLINEESIKSGSTELCDPDAAQLVGKEGVALSALRPSGIAMINGKRLDVLAEGEFVMKGEPVVVTEVQGLHISVVKK